MRPRIPPPADLINMHPAAPARVRVRLVRQDKGIERHRRPEPPSGRVVACILRGPNVRACSQICGPSSSAPLRVLPVLAIAGKRVLAAGPPLHQLPGACFPCYSRFLPPLSAPSGAWQAPCFALGSSLCGRAGPRLSCRYALSRSSSFAPSMGFPMLVARTPASRSAISMCQG